MFCHTAQNSHHRLSTGPCFIKLSDNYYITFHTSETLTRKNNSNCYSYKNIIRTKCNHQDVFWMATNIRAPITNAIEKQKKIICLQPKFSDHIKLKTVTQNSAFQSHLKLCSFWVCYMYSFCCRNVNPQFISNVFLGTLTKGKKKHILT